MRGQGKTPVAAFDALEDLIRGMLKARSDAIVEAMARGELTEAVVDGQSFIGVHLPASCVGEVCVVHSPTDHHLRKWQLHWRSDRGIFERICPHGIGHPDPDQFEFWRKAGRDWESIHGCDGCCR